MKQFIFVCFLLSVVALSADAQTDSLLRAQIDSLIARELSPESHVGVAIYDLHEKRDLYAYQAEKLSRPASTMKLLTAITLLSLPDRDAPFATALYHTGVIARDTLFGDVYIKGGFDPEFADEDMDTLVAALDTLPISHITGAIYGDVSMKDSLYFGSGWIWDDNPAAYQPYLSPLMFNKGKITVSVRPAAVRGEPIEVNCTPLSSYYTVYNDALTRTPSAGRFRITRRWLDESNDILITGNLYERRSAELNLASSHDFFMHTFVERLNARGIASPTTYAFAECPPDSLLTLVVQTETPMQEALNEMLKESDNLNAEAFLYRIGVQYSGHRHVSANDGLKAVRDLITQLGYDPKRYPLADGCGLSNYDFLSPELLVAFLRYAYNDTEIFQRLYKALPTAGIDGTLENRMKGTAAYRRIQAKTGTVTGISTLAGYAQTRSGRQLAFAIMNQNFLSASSARRLQDALCAFLCEL
jgi:D-alanyl-D-alanine carboxypeptidase/D-alanyl-D-alanine-endopeptidase (penicillin-binding protein 4)